MASPTKVTETRRAHKRSKLLKKRNKEARLRLAKEAQAKK